jgi:hypothetical protein
MSTAQMVLALVALLLLGLLPVLWCVLVLPSREAATQRQRIERNQQEAMWRIHQETVAGIAELLKAAQEAQSHEA